MRGASAVTTLNPINKAGNQSQVTFLCPELFDSNQSSEFRLQTAAASIAQDVMDLQTRAPTTLLPPETRATFG
jgi:hypothetical protein